MGSQDDLKQLLGFISSKELRRRNIKKGRPIKDKKYETPNETRQRQKARKKWVAEHAPPPRKSSSGGVQPKEKADGENKFATKFAQGNPLIKATAGFWEEVGQKMATGLDVTLDTLEKLNNTKNVFAEVLDENNLDRSQEPDPKGTIDQIKSNFVNSLDEVARDLTNPGQFVKAAKEAKKGFHGERRSSGARLIKLAHKRNPNNEFTGNKKVQGIGGLGFDIVSDPLNFVGAGIVSKPLRKAAEFAMDRELASELAGLGIKNPDGIELNADDFLKMMGEHKPNRVPKGLSYSERRAWRKANTVKGRDAFRSHKDTARRANRRLQNFEAIKASLPKSTDELMERSEHFQKLKAMGDILDFQFREQVNKAGVDALTSALKKYDDSKSAESVAKAIAGSAPQLGHVTIGGEMMNMADDVIQASNLRRVIATHGFVNRALRKSKRLEGLKKTDTPEFKSLQEAIGKDKKRFEKLVSGWTFGGGLKGAKEVRNILDTVDSMVENDSIFQRLVNEAHQVKLQRNKVSKFVGSGKNKKINPTWKTHDSALREIYNSMDFEKALIARSLLEHKAQGKNPFVDELSPDAMAEVGAKRLRLQEHESQIAELENIAKTKRFDDEAGEYVDITPDTTAGLNEEDANYLKLIKKQERQLRREIDNSDKSYGLGKDLADIDAKISEITEKLRNTPVGPTVSTGDDVVDVKELKEGLKVLKADRNKLMLAAVREKIEQDAVEAPEEVRNLIDDGIDGETLFQKVKNGEITGRWADAFRESVQNRMERRKNTLVRSELRNRRALLQKALDNSYDVKDLPKRLQSMFSKTKESKVAKLKITVDGKDITKGGIASRKALEHLVRDADKKKAKAINKFAEEQRYDEIKAKYDLDIQIDPLNPGRVSEVSKTGAVRVEPEWIAFDRIFTEQHGMSPSAAIHELRKAEGKYVKVHNHKEPLTAARFVDWARQHPAEVGPNGFGLDITLAGKTYRYSDLVKKYGSPLPAKYREMYGDKVAQWLDETPDAVVNKKMHGVFETRMKRQRRERERNKTGEFNLGVKTSEDELQHFTEDELARLEKKALDDVFDEMGAQWAKEGNEGYRLSAGVTDEPIVLGRNPKPEPTVKDFKDDAFRYLEHKYRMAREQGKLAVDASPNPQSAQQALENRLAKMWDEKEAYKERVAKAAEEAFETQKNVEKRLREHMLLSSISRGDKVQRNSIRLTFAGAKIFPDVNVDALFKAVEIFSGAPMIEKAVSVWSKSFSPASKLAPELNKARLRAQSRTPELIKQHVIELHKVFGKHKPGSRTNAFKTFKAQVAKSEAATNPIAKKIEAEFDNLVPYFDGSIRIGTDHLDVGKINRFLPDEFKLFHPKAGGDTRNIVIKSGRDIVWYMRGMRENSDPMRALWAMRVATEQAQADLAMKMTIKETFGVKRELAPSKMNLSEHGKLIEELHNGHNWVTVPRMGDEYYFDPETATEINKLLDMMSPGRQHEMMKVYDKALRAWKSVVTVYNPGYYTRNGVGEVMMGMFDGVGAQSYATAARIMSYRHPDPTKEALKQLNPYTAAKAAADSPHVGKGTALRLQSGKYLSIAEADLLYNQAGLKSGFVSTEFDHVFPVSGSLRATVPGRVGSKINDSVRSAGEQYEDYFRMAHFVSRLKRAPKGMTPEDAADWAANYVRKYHFDYTDFTPFEKSVMIRVFPFYKWTRKAMPLMASMLFTRPGLITLYPKTMTGLGYATGAVDPMEDENGILPNYEEVTPDWVKGLFAYPIGEPDEEDAQNYANLATPAMDIYKMAREPLNTAVGMGSPLIKQPLEHFVLDRTMDPEFARPLEATKTQSNARQHAKHVARSTPIGALLDKIYESRQSKKDDETYNDQESVIHEPGKNNIDEVLFSYLSGIGVYENNDTRKGQEVFFNKEKYPKRVRKQYGVD